MDRERLRMPAKLRLPLATGPVLAVLMLLGAIALGAWQNEHDKPIGWGALALLVAAVLLLLAWTWLMQAFRSCYANNSNLMADLQQRSQRLEETRRIAMIGDWQWQLDSGQLQWSDALFDIYGQPHRADGALTIDEAVQWLHPQDRERMHACFAESKAGTGPLEAEFRIVRPDGEVRSVYVRGEWADPERRLQRGIKQDITELARARAQLRSVEEKYAFLFQANPLPMMVFDRDDLRILAVNDAMVDSYGYRREELLAGSMLDIRPGEDAEAVRAAALTESDERPQGHVWTHLRKDGSRLRAAIHTRDIDFDGRPARLVLAQDVTERERNEQRFQLVARATSDAVWDWDLETGTTWRSENVFGLFGYGPGEFGPSLAAWEQLLHPDDRERVIRSVHAGIDSDQVEWAENYRLRRKDGSYAQVHDRAFIMRDEHGHALRAIGGMLDVTRQRQDEADLRLLRRAVEATDSGILIADARSPDLPTVYVNPAFEHITGYRSADVLGRDCRFVRPDQRDQQAIAAIRRGLAEHVEVRALLRNQRKDGSLFWNDFSMAPVRDDDGTVTHFVSVLTDVSERQQAQEQLAHRATHDELTGLPNRQLLLDRLQQALFNAQRYAREVAVLFMDLDQFKLINDSLGHNAGDEALRVVAQRLETIVRDTDTLGRFGGDEFVLVLTEQTGDEGLERVVARINDVFARPVEIGGMPHYITPSIGYCRYPDAGDDAGTLLMRADLAMYQAKQQGRNRAVAYRPDFDSGVSQRLRLASELRSALNRDEFRLVFQPLFKCDGAIVGMEALLRWQHPERGLLLPGEFIDVCEDSGLIVPIGRWVLHEAARHHALLARHGFGHLRMAVNVSASQFQPGLYDDVASAIVEHQLTRGALELELTESVIMASPESAIEIMQRLDALGVAISVDDFGTGYSSLAYLKRLPIDRLKIDRTFVRDLGDDDDDAAICASIINLAHSLGLTTVAEGVETEQQRDWLQARGCDELQGFLLGRPQDFERLLAQLAPLPA